MSTPGVQSYINVPLRSFYRALLDTLGSESSGVARIDRSSGERVPTWTRMSGGDKAALEACALGGCDALVVARVARAHELRFMGVPGLSLVHAQGPELLAEATRLHHAVAGCAPDVVVGDEIQIRLLERPAYRGSALFASVRLAAWIAQSSGERVLRIDVEEPRGPAADQAERELGIGLQWRQAVTCLYFARSLLRSRGMEADEEVRAALGPETERFYRQALSTICGERVRAVVAWRMRTGAPRIAEVASQLHVSQRSLQRYLRNEGCSFRELVHRIRVEEVVTMLERGVDDPGIIARRLGGLNLRDVKRLIQEVEVAGT